MYPVWATFTICYQRLCWSSDEAKKSIDPQVNLMSERITLAQLVNVNSKSSVISGSPYYPASNAVPAFENSYFHTMLEKHICAA